MRHRLFAAAVLVGAAALAACAPTDHGLEQAAAATPAPGAAPTDTPAPRFPRTKAPAPAPTDPAARPTTTPAPALTDPAAHPTATPAPDRDARPDWLGRRILPLRPNGFGEVTATPHELVDRRLPPPSDQPLPPPPDGQFAASIDPVPRAVARRSTWTPACPVALEDLRYVTVSFWGFDDEPHTGELLVHVTAAEDLIEVFAALFEARFPIEEMRIVTPHELDAPPTGDGNNTTAFVCRPAVGQQRWSEHAYGLAIDVNPFHNPYARGDLVLPELASAYVDRDRHRPGMIQQGDVVTESFAAIGWGWGGHWSSVSDWMHFSVSGR